MSTPHPALGRRRTPGVAVFGVALLLGAATCAGWLAWDHSYYYDPAVGAYQGPYRPAQVVGCGLTFGVLTALLAGWWRPVVVAAGMTVGFWVVWTVSAAMADDTGLYAVGAVLVLGGLCAGSAGAAAIGYGARPLLRRLLRGLGVQDRADP